jgi:hypothetical protein
MVFGSASSFYRADDSNRLQTELRRHYKLAMAKVDGKGTLVVEGSKALAIRKEGVVGFGRDESSFADLCPSQFVDGELSPSKSPACTTLGPAARKTFRLSQPVCVTSIDVADATDSVALSIVGCDASNRVRFDDAYRAKLIFVFPKGALARSAPTRIEEVIGQVLAQPDLPQATGSPAGSTAKSGDEPPTATGAANPCGESTPSTEPELSPGAGDAKPCATGASTPDPATAPAAGDAKPENVGDGSDPVPPPSSKDKSTGAGSVTAVPPATATPDPAPRPAPELPPESRIGIGQTTDQVKAILGPPKTTTTRGRKIIFRYPNLKVVFVNGTVSAVEKI